MEDTFRLLVPATDAHPPAARSVELDGIQWFPTEFTHIPVAGEAAPYTCISYAWGRGKTTNPLVDGHSMSDRAVAAVGSAIAAVKPAAIWFDAMCVPAAGTARAACLRGMGAIYGAAEQVVAVLSAPCAVVLRQISGTGRVEPEALAILENDAWITRAWTYQEIANSKSIRFVAEGDGENSVAGDELLNRVGQAIADYKKAQGFDAFTWRVRYPWLDSLEDLLADYMTANYLERSAYQAMSAMHRRLSEQPDDYFNAMIGAITAAPPESVEAVALHPAEYFMRVCETKGDFSFIYCDAPRSAVAGRRWRPVAGRIPAVFAWHSYGDGQTGQLYPTHLQLNNMCRLNAGAVHADAAKLVSWWLQGNDSGSACVDVVDLLLARLQQAGFTGCGQYLELERGYFFAQSPLPADEVDVVVANGVKWVHGSPGLLVSPDGAGMLRFRDVGVFVGRVPEVGESINLG